MVHYSPVELKRDRTPDRVVVEQDCPANTVRVGKDTSLAINMSQVEQNGHANISTEEAFDQKECGSYNQSSCGGNQSKGPEFNRDFNPPFDEEDRTHGESDHGRIKKEYPIQHARLDMTYTQPPARVSPVHQLPVPHSLSQSGTPQSITEKSKDEYVRQNNVPDMDLQHAQSLDNLPYITNSQGDTGQAVIVPRFSNSTFQEPKTCKDQDISIQEFSMAANSHPLSPAINSEGKHTRAPSGDITHFSFPNKRLHTNGDNSSNDAYNYHNGYQHLAPSRPAYSHHRREDSAALDILSAVADESKEQLEMAAGKRQPGINKRGRPNSELPLDHRMDPPQAIRTAYHFDHVRAPPFVAHSGQYYYHALPHGHAPLPYYHHEGYFQPQAGVPYHPYMLHPHRSPSYPVQYAPIKDPKVHPKAQVYSTGGSTEIKSDPNDIVHPGSEWHKGGTTTGSQTFVTAISVGNEHRTVIPGPYNRSCKNSDAGDKPSKSSSAGHHRKLSSFSSLGTLMGTVFPEQDQIHQKTNSERESHHRTNMSSASLLQGLDGDMIFMPTSHSSTSKGNHNPTNIAGSEGDSQLSDVVSTNEPSGHNLAQGGSSRRIRRKCNVSGCSNRVVQGGLCISHGAKRKTCNHPGCTKNVKKAGFCSTHGPARKRCENIGCDKVAVQGGKCIAHGAKKKPCSHEGCSKQAIMSGMCKKHHDLFNGIITANYQGEGCIVVDEKPSDKAITKRPTHTRGLSIFQEISAESVHSLLSSEDVVTVQL
jgi:hypothetical protein